MTRHVDLEVDLEPLLRYQGGKGMDEACYDTASVLSAMFASYGVRPHPVHDDMMVFPDGRVFAVSWDLKDVSETDEAKQEAEPCG